MAGPDGEAAEQADRGESARASSAGRSPAAKSPGFRPTLPSPCDKSVMPLAITLGLLAGHDGAPAGAVAVLRRADASLVPFT